MTKLSTPERNALPTRQFAFPAQRKAPLENASHVRNAVARFDQVKDVSDAERDAAWQRIEVAARVHGVVLHKAGWRDLQARHRHAAGHEAGAAPEDAVLLDQRP